jgi:hypothetical protein
MPFTHRYSAIGLLAASATCVLPLLAADIIVSAQDGKFVRVEGRATNPQPADPAADGRRAQPSRIRDSRRQTHRYRSAPSTRGRPRIHTLDAALS